MTEFESSSEPLQNWLNSTEVRVQESSVRLHDLLAKKQELNKLQVLQNPTFSGIVKPNSLDWSYLFHWHSLANIS